MDRLEPRTNGPALQPGRLPDVPAGLARRRLSLRTMVAFFGPGAIIASLTVGSGETVLASRLGAVFGLAILWVLVVGAVAKAAVVYASNRYIVLTGEHGMAGLARAIPGPRGWFPAVIGVLAAVSFPFVASALATGIGDYLATLAGGQGVLWGLGLLVLAAAIAWFGWYSLLERAQLVIVALMVALVFVAVLVAQPDWLAVLAGFVPQPAEYAPFVAEKYPDVAARPAIVEIVVFMGGLGGGMYDYVGYAGFMRDKRWGMLQRPERHGDDPVTSAVALQDTPEERARVKGWSRAPLGDVVLSFVVMAVIAVAFVITGNQILRPNQQVPEDNDVLTYQAQFLGAVHPVFEYFYVVAIIMVFFGTMYAIWEVYTRTAYESFAPVFSRVRAAGISATRRVVYAYVLVGGAALILSGADFVELITPANIVGGTIACGVYGFGLLVLERTVLPKALRIHRVGQVLAAFGAAVLVVGGTAAFLVYLGLFS